MITIDGAEPLLLVWGLLLATGAAFGYWLIRAGQSLRNEMRHGENARAALSELQREHEKFVYITSHDLQEPVRAVEAFSQLIMRRYGDGLSAETCEFMNHVQQGAARMRRMIFALRDYSRTCTAELQLQPLNVDKLLTDVTTTLERREQFRQAEYSTTLLPRVRADKKLLEEMIRQLLDNALQFADPERSLQIRVSGRQVDDQCHFTVSDNGIGIPDTELESIFEPFKRLQRNDEKGTGMGLTICRQIVKRHGGQIRAEGGRETGACFHITLPAA